MFASLAALNVLLVCQVLRIALLVLLGSICSEICVFKIAPSGLTEMILRINVRPVTINAKSADTQRTTVEFVKTTTSCLEISVRRIAPWNFSRTT